MDHLLSESKPNVFISYAWGDASHNEWIKNLSAYIDSRGANSVIDKKLPYGKHLRLFMDWAIKNSDVVLIICTPKYKEKSSSLVGGVGYEFNIISRSLLENIRGNEKYLTVLKDGDHQTAVPDFLGDFKYFDLRGGSDYDTNMDALIQQILNAPLKQPEQVAPKNKYMDKKYSDFVDLLPIIQNEAATYINKILNLDSESNVTSIVATTIHNWESEIEEYSSTVKSKFDSEHLKRYEDYLEDFKNKVFGEALWTVRAARQTRDPDLARYKKDFREAEADEVYDTVASIITATDDYVKNTANSIDYSTINTASDLKMEYLEEDGMQLKRIIGYGIRSEILHRSHPAYFPVMTQQSLWAMYFLSNSAEEFITIEQKTRQGLIRVSHNWQYPYERFTFIMNTLANQLAKVFSKYGQKFDDKYRFGYVNMLLTEIKKIHKKDIELLHKWEAKSQ